MTKGRASCSEARLLRFGITESNRTRPDARGTDTLYRVCSPRRTVPAFAFLGGPP